MKLRSWPRMIALSWCWAVLSATSDAIVAVLDMIICTRAKTGINLVLWIRQDSSTSISGLVEVTAGASL